MPRFFISKECICDSCAQLVGGDAHHISRSLRMKVGEKLTLCDGEGHDYLCEISSLSDSGVSCKVLECLESRSEPPYFATVFQGLAKGDRFDTVIQKSVECGASKIVPLMSKRCTVKLEKSDFAKKCARWNKIAEEAAKQCGRGIVPVVTEPVTFDAMLSELKCSDLPLFCYEEGTHPIKRALSACKSGHPNVDIVIGPEGGFEPEEADAVKTLGIKAVTLGTRILRTESAAPFVLACLSYAIEQSNE